MSRASSVELVHCLENQNGWRRDTAQRLLVERQDQKAIPALKKLARKGQLPETRVQALWTLEGLRVNNRSGLDDDTLRVALNDKHEEVQVIALKLAESRLRDSSPSPKISVAVEKMIKDPSPRVRFQLALTLGEIEAPERSDLLLAQLAREGIKDKWQSLAIQSSVRNKNGLFLKTLAHQNPEWFSEPTLEQSKFLEQIAIQIGARNNDTELVASLPVLLGGMPGPKRLEIVAGWADGLARANQSLQDWMTRPSAGWGGTSQALSRWIAQAQSTATNPAELLPHRLAAIRLLKQTKSESPRSVLLGLLQPGNPPEVQSAASAALIDSGERELAANIFAGWGQYSASARRQMLSSALRSPTATAALVDALEAGKVLPDELDASTRQALRNVQNPDLAKRLRRIVQTDSAPSRDDVVRNFEPSLKLAGDRQRGALTFAKLCLPCHAIQGKGNHVGPDLSGVASRPKEALLVDILDPSRQVTPDFISYTLTTTQGETVTGLIAAESANSVTVRRAGQADETISRTQIAGLRAEGKSLMPDGLEQGLTQQDLADLLDFLQKPDNKLLPDEK